MAEGVVVVDDLFGGQAEEAGVVAQETAHVDVGQVDVELVALELVQVVAADLGRFRRLANGDALTFACFFQTFANILHGGNEVR